jgi:hypothetical protein
MLVPFSFVRTTRMVDANNDDSMTVWSAKQRSSGIAQNGITLPHQQPANPVAVLERPG